MSYEPYDEIDEVDEVGSRRRALVVVGGLAAVGVAVVAAALVGIVLDRDRVLSIGEVEIAFAELSRRADPAPEVRRVDVYRGHGAWVDVFDFEPAYAGEDPPITPRVIGEMRRHGVDTVFLQAARLDDRSPEGIVDRWLLAEFLQRAHRADIDVVGWYLPEWEVDRDIARLRAIADFDVLGQRFDGVAVDIEWVADDLEPQERSARLFDLSQRASTSIDSPLGAIVMPPVLMEVLNPDFWPGFPWRAIAPHYDAWLPMSYWSFRTGELADGYSYHLDSVRRLRTNIGDPDALVHGIGGIGATDDPPADADEPLASLTELEAFARSLVDSRSAGGSVYDWNTMSPAAREQFAAEFETGVLVPLRQGAGGS